MKFIILSCLLGFAAASFMKEAAPLVDESVKALWAGMHEVGSLREALGMPDAYELDRLERDIETEVGKNLKETLDALLEKIKDAIDHGKTVKEDMIAKLKEIKEKLKDMKIDMGEKAKELLEKIKDKAKDFVKNLLEKLGLSKKRSLHDMMDYVAKLKFRDLIEDIKQKILSNEVIQKIREYIRNFVTTNPIIQKMKEAILKLSDFDLRQFIKNLLHLDTSRDRRSIKDFWEKIKNFFKDLNIVIKEKFMKFGEWVKEKYNKGIEKLKEKHGIIKAIAMEFIANYKDMSGELMLEGMEFLRPYKEDLGELWNQLKDIVKKAIGIDVPDY